MGQSVQLFTKHISTALTQQAICQLSAFKQPAYLRLAAEHLGRQLELMKAFAAGEAKIVGLLILSALLFGEQCFYTLICCPSLSC